MLDVRLTAYVVPVAEQPQAGIIPTVRIQNFADEDATITGLVRIYRISTGLMIYSSELPVTESAHGTILDLEALTTWDPPAPADDDYQIVANISAKSHPPDDWHVKTHSLPAYIFDIKAVPAGPIPGGHHATHESGGIDEPSLTGMLGLLATPQTAALHAVSHQTGEADELNVTGLSGELASDQPALAHDIAGARHTSGATPGQILQADANGLPVDATNTDADVADAVSKRNCRAVGEASNATPTPNADTTDLYYLSALAEAASFGAPTGTPVEGQKLIVRILDDATARALAWDAGAGGYIARGTALPATTILSKHLYVGFIYNAIAVKWDCVASSQEA